MNNMNRIAGAVIVIGASDSGKSTFVRWLVKRLCRYPKRLGWLDGDIGRTVLVGIQRLRERALAEEAGGGALKHWKIEVLRPCTVIALQRGRELEHILTPLKQDRHIHLHVLPSAEAVRPRSSEQRANRRRALFQRYFQSSVKQSLRYSEPAVYGLERAGRLSLAALQDQQGFSLALGVVLSIRREVLQIPTPLSDLTQVESLRFGTLRLDPVTGREL